MTDPLVSLEALLPDLPAAVEQRRLGDGLARATAALKTSTRQIERIEALLELAQDLAYGSDEVQAETVEAVRDEAREVGGHFEAAETPLNLDKAVQQYERDLSPAVHNLDRNVRQHWQLVTARQFQPLVAVGELLSRIDAGSDLGKRLAACGASASTPTSLTGRPLLEHVQALLRERERLQARRREEHGEGDIAAFVNALAENRASLGMVTEEVRAWLEENHALNKLKVRAGT